MDILGLIPSFGGLLYTVVAFVIALSIIVAVHEYGHYIVGRWSGIHAEVFSLGFGPVLFTRTDRRGTRWQVAALPFGGYVKFLGDADAASAKDGAAIAGLSPQARRRTMHGAPLWARAATVAAGPMFNFILAVLIFTAYFILRGVPTDTPVVDIPKPMPAFADALQPGDAIVAINSIPTPNNEAFYAVVEKLAPSPSAIYSIIRDGTTSNVEGPFPYPPVVYAVQPDTPAQDAGLRVGDVIVSVDTIPIYAFQELRDRVSSSDGKPVVFSVWRDGTTFDVTMVPRRMDTPIPGGGFETRFLIGLGGGLFYVPEVRRPGILEAVGIGLEKVRSMIVQNIWGIGYLVTGKISTCNMDGPIGIAKLSGAAAAEGWESFIGLIAGLSTAVGLMNLFPIPVLDGGHLLFHAYEAVTRRPPSDRALRVLMGAGLALLLALMAFALTNDLFCP